MEIIGGLKTLPGYAWCYHVDSRARPKPRQEAPRPNADSLCVWRHLVAITGIAAWLLSFPSRADGATHLSLLE